MTEIKNKQKQASPTKVSTQRIKQKVTSIRVKLTILTLTLIALITAGSSLISIQNMDKVLLESLVNRGASIALSAAIPAGYSLLTGDRLALDNLASKIEAAQADISYVAILDLDSHILAHSKLEETGTLFPLVNGTPMATGSGFTMYQVSRGQRLTYEFQAPIQFADNQVGQVVVGIDATALSIAKNFVRDRTVLISIVVLAFGALGTFMLSKLITAPIERLTTGVSQITAGDYHVEVKVTSSDELGELTRSFNEMSQVILSQKNRLQGYAVDLEDAYISTIKILSAALDARDNYTHGHSARVASLSLLIGKRLNLSGEELKELEMACFLHDIGKIHVPDKILNKPTPLDKEEYQVIKNHPMQGAEILHLAESLHKYIPVVLHHHEHYNGQGYPHGLKEDEIHLFAQIVAITDSYDAMTTSRPYRKGCTRDEALVEIVTFRGVQFNPELVDLFLDVLKDYKDDHTLLSSGGPDEIQSFLHAHATVTHSRAERMRTAADESDQTEPIRCHKVS